jgi:hypothetical protein
VFFSSERTIDLSSIIGVVEGISTDLLKKKLNDGEIFGGHAERFFSLILPSRTLDLEASSSTQAKVLASKFYGLYSLLRDLLSKQLHYDW